ncbi:MAG: ATP synthase F1 subunit epsilon [Oscillospiraceae bacterium]|nr:ATP synthase F1 subunit epsilon [Oscillospiraceae bacterium]
MTPFKLKIVTPSGVFFGKKEDKHYYTGRDVVNVIVRTTVGDKGILAKHEPYIAALPIGIVRIMVEDNKYRNAAISTGTIQVTEGGDTTILVQSCEWCDEIDVARAEAAKKRAEEDMARAEETDENVKYKVAEFKLKRALNRLDNAEIP